VRNGRVGQNFNEIIGADRFGFFFVRNGRFGQNLNVK
jgi:hypothetical protein